MSPPGPAMNPSSDIATEYKNFAMEVQTSEGVESHRHPVSKVQTANSKPSWR
jgi:hypothetical protein